MAIEGLTKLCPGVLFDWRLYAERGIPSHCHHHRDGRRIDECELEFLRKISDDERLSLLTAISDEDGETADGRSGTATATTKAFQCTGAVRKAGFLSVKKWLLRKRNQVELARKRGWKGYWVCLKGTTLLFYPCDTRDGRAIEPTPRHLIIVDGSILQPIPEHPKRDFVFCLSTAFGDAYLFQAPCQSELDKWISAIHQACAASLARNRGKMGTLNLLQEEIHRMQEQCDENEQIHCDVFRLRCYMASLQGMIELPNPKSLLTHVSKSSKLVLSKQLGVFTVSSFHAYVCARNPLSTLLNRAHSRRRARSRPASRLAADEVAVRLDDQILNIGVRTEDTIEDLVFSAMQDRAPDYYIKLILNNGTDYIPSRHDAVQHLPPSQSLILCTKVLYQLELSRPSVDSLFGFSVEAELVDSVRGQEELCVYVSRVEVDSIAYNQGLARGDEIMVINGAIVSDLDMMFIESVLQEELCLCLMIRSCRAEPPPQSTLTKSTDDYIESLVCPPPPSDNTLTEEAISKLIVPPPLDSIILTDTLLNGGSLKPNSGSDSGLLGRGGSQDSSTGISRTRIEDLPLPDTPSPPPHARDLEASNQGASGNNHCSIDNSCLPPPPPPHLSNEEKMKKVLRELVDTERTYLDHLDHLLKVYLEPIRDRQLLPESEVAVLFGNISDIMEWQRHFYSSLREADGLSDVSRLFIQFSDKFKLYSSFCASHSKAQKMIHSSSAAATSDSNAMALQELLQEASKGQHAFSLESYLIKPIQRILKYPLLLQQLKNYSDPASEEQSLISEALKSIEKVAEHINEMQRIHEEYGAIFDHLQRQYLKNHKQDVDLKPSELIHYGGVEWLNMHDYLGKIKKGLELNAMVFVFKKAVIFLCKERVRQKKKQVKMSDVELIRYQVLIPVNEVQVRATSVRSDLVMGADGNMESLPASHFQWELIHLRCTQLQKRSEKVYQLANSTNEFRMAFLRTIRQIIRESVRSLSLPSERSTPTSQRGTPTPPQPVPLQKSATSPTAVPSPGSGSTGTAGRGSKPAPPPRAPTTQRSSSGPPGEERRLRARLESQKSFSEAAPSESDRSPADSSSQAGGASD